jgi:hypothetical protein
VKPRGRQTGVVETVLFDVSCQGGQDTVGRRYLAVAAFGLDGPK